MAMLDDKFTPLMSLSVDVGISETFDIGMTPQGKRTVVPIKGGWFEGDRLSGIVRPSGFDWSLELTDGSKLIDVRTLLETDDGALIYMTYHGRFSATQEAVTALTNKESIGEADYSLAAHCRFECGDSRYDWLNEVIAVGLAKFGSEGPVYTIFRIG